jgi:glc operon protein GlcG
MRFLLIVAATAMAAVTASSSAFAQGVPEKMPFDIPYGTPIAYAQAIKLVDAAAEEAKKRNWKMNIAVVDNNGDLVAFQRMEGAQIASVGISQGKARTAARYRRESEVFFKAYESGHQYVSTLDPTLVASPGGIPLVENGKIIGAIGCSGGTGDQDAVTCKAGAALVK